MIFRWGKRLPAAACSNLPASARPVTLPPPTCRAVKNCTGACVRAARMESARGRPAAPLSRPNPPSIPTALAPVTGSTLPASTPFKPTLRWKAVGGIAAGYVIQLANNSAFSAGLGSARGRRGRHQPDLGQRPALRHLLLAAALLCRRPDLFELGQHALLPHPVGPERSDQRAKPGSAGGKCHA